MSVETTIMKNLIDMGIVESNSDDIISSSFRTQDNNYIINLKRKPRLSFLTESDTHYVCEIEIITSLGIPVLSIQANEIQMSSVIDTLYTYIEANIKDEVYQYFNPMNTIPIPRLLKLSVKDNDYTLGRFGYYDNVKNNSYNLSIFDKLDDQLVLRISTVLDYKYMMNLLEKMYYVFLIDIQ